MGTNTYSWRTLLPWVPACGSLRNCFEPLTSLLGSWSVIPVAWSGFPFKPQVPTPSKQAELSSWVGSPAVLLVGHVGNRTSDDVFSSRLPPPHPSSAVCHLSLLLLSPLHWASSVGDTHLPAPSTSFCSGPPSRGPSGLFWPLTPSDIHTPLNLVGTGVQLCTHIYTRTVYRALF